MAKGAYIGVDGKARKVKKGYIGVENFVPRALPSGYTQVEYIQSSGTQYFNTGFKPNQDTRVVMDAQILKDPGTSTAIYFGCRGGGYFYELYKAGSGANLTFLYNTAYSQYFTVEYAKRRTVEVNKNTATVDGVTKTYTYAQFSVDYALYLGADNSTGSASAITAMRIYSCQIYNNGTLVRDYVPCKNASGVAGLYDMVNNTFSGSATSTAFVAGSSATSVARKIKKAYIGVGGVARPCWSGGELTAYGTITPLSKAREQLAATSVGNYAVFAGGDTGSYSATLNTVDAYDKSLTRTIPTTLTDTKQTLAATTVGGHALFAGGAKNGSPVSSVDSYDTSLTKSKRTALSVGRYNFAATTVGNRALFGGGSAGYDIKTVDAYDSSLTRTTATDLQYKRSDLVAITIGGKALFVGGYDYNNENVLSYVDAYDASLTHTKPTSLSVARRQLAAACTENHAIFAGGNKTQYGSNYGALANVEAYDTSLTKSTITALSVAMQELTGTSLGGNALFGGGSWKTDVNAYNQSLTLRSDFALSVGANDMAAASVGDFALFAGGHRGYIGSEVDVFTIA